MGHIYILIIIKGGGHNVFDLVVVGHKYADIYAPPLLFWQTLSALVAYRAVAAHACPEAGQSAGRWAPVMTADRGERGRGGGGVTHAKITPRK